MKRYTVAIDVSPLSSGHKIRGVGHYTSHLQSSLQSLHSQTCEFLFFVKKQEITQHVDLFHIPYFDPFFLQLPFRDIRKTVVTVHDLTPLLFPHLFPPGIKGSIKWQMNKFLLRRVAGIITPSESSKKDIHALTGVALNKIFVTSEGVDDVFYKISDHKKIVAIKKKYNLPETFALYVGDVTPNKNLSRLVRAMDAQRISLVLVGKSITETDYDASNAMNRDRVYVQQFAKDHTNIYFTGFVPDEDLNLLYNAAACVVYPSLYEGFGLPVVQAFRCGTPVVTSDTSSFPEITADHAILVNPTDEKAIGDAVSSVMRDSVLRKKLISEALVWSETFTWENMAEKVVSAYEKIIHE